MIKRCSFCRKLYRVDKNKVPNYLCKKCKSKAKELPESDKSELKLISECEDLGIISIVG